MHTLLCLNAHSAGTTVGRETIFELAVELPGCRQQRTLLSDLNRKSSGKTFKMRLPSLAWEIAKVVPGEGGQSWGEVA